MEREEDHRCPCVACKKGVTYGPKPKPGADNRPWGVFDGNDKEVTRAWSERDAKIVAGLKGQDHTYRPVQRRRAKVKK